MSNTLADRLTATARGLTGLSVSHPHIVTQELLGLLFEAASRLSSPEGTPTLPCYCCRESGCGDGCMCKPALSSPSSAPAATPQVLRCSLPMGHGGDHFYSIKVSAAGSLTGLTCAAYALDSEASPRVSAATPPKCEECDGRGEYLDAPGHVLDGSTYLTRCHVCGGTGNASPRVSAATPAPGLDYQRVFDWACDPKRQRANFTFTEGTTNHTVACLIEDVMVNVSAAERPEPTCATCKWWAANERVPALPPPPRKGPARCLREEEYVRVMVPGDFGCTLHEPAPPGPVAQEKEEK